MDRCAKTGGFHPKALVTKNLPWRVRQVIVPSDDVGDFHKAIVHHAGEIVRRHPGGLHNHEILDEVVFPFHGPRTMSSKCTQPSWGVLNRTVKGFPSLRSASRWAGV
jgi:hypothetical protein